MEGLEKKGDCYQSAFNALVDMGVERRQKCRLVHGIVVNTGEAKGLRMGHAWIEEHTQFYGHDFVLVHDCSNGHDATIPATLYYYAGEIDPEDSVEYTYEEAMDVCCRAGTYGPWHTMPHDVA